MLSGLCKIRLNGSYKRALRESGTGPRRALLPLVMAVPLGSMSAHVVGLSLIPVASLMEFLDG